MAKFVGRIILLMNEYMSEGYFGEMLKYPYIYRVIYLIVIKMLKVVAFMKQVATVYCLFSNHSIYKQDYKSL